MSRYCSRCLLNWGDGFGCTLAGKSKCKKFSSQAVFDKYHRKRRRIMQSRFQHKPRPKLLSADDMIKLADLLHGMKTALFSKESEVQL